MLNKYTTIINIMWQRGLTYRFTIFAYRIGEIAELIVLILMWTAIYNTTETIQGYTVNEMITYVIIGSLIHLFTRNFLAGFLSRDIKDGKLSLFLLKPITHFQYSMASEFGRISLPFIMSITSQLAIIAIFTDKIIANTDPAYLLIMGTMVLFAFTIEFLLGYLVGLIAFWADEVEGLYLTIDRVKKFFSGGYFPLSLLPITFVNVSYALPFAYSFFVPAQLYLQKIDLLSGLKGLGVQLVWIMVLAGVVRLVWRRGIRRYEGVGI